VVLYNNVGATDKRFLFNQLQNIEAQASPLDGVNELPNNRIFSK